MKFRISRTGAWDEKPCEEAFKADMPTVWVRTVDDPAKLNDPKNPAEWWYSEGTNHRVVNGCICRDMIEKDVWAVEADDLIAFISKYGKCVVMVDDSGNVEVEIYDDYRE